MTDHSIPTIEGMPTGSQALAVTNDKELEASCLGNHFARAKVQTEGGDFRCSHPNPIIRKHIQRALASGLASELVSHGVIFVKKLDQMTGAFKLASEAERDSYVLRLLHQQHGNDDGQNEITSGSSASGDVLQQEKDEDEDEHYLLIY